MIVKDNFPSPMGFYYKFDTGAVQAEIVSVVTKSGSTISAALLVPLDPAQAMATPPADDSAGLLEVIDAQLAAIDELSKAAEGVSGADYSAQAKKLSDLQEWADQFSDLVEDLCMALGYPRNPIAPTGIPELDLLVKLSK